MLYKAYLRVKMTKTAAFIRRNYATLMLCIIIFCMFIILGYSILASQDVDKLTSKQDVQLAKIEQLTKQNKTLTEDTIYLADRNIFYQKCLARLFVEYTQNQSPIHINALNQCDFSVEKDGSFKQTFNPTLNDKRETIPTTQQPKTKPKPAEEKPAPPQTREVCTIDLLGIKLNCRQEPV